MMVAGDLAAVHPLVRLLADEGLLRCPTCRVSALRGIHYEIACDACGSHFPSYNRVTDLFGLVVGAPSPEELARAVALAPAVADALQLSQHESLIDAIATVLGRTAAMSANHDEFDAEIRDIADRFGIEAPASPLAALVRASVQPAPAMVELIVERHYVPSRLPAGSRTTANVRFRNQGADAVSSASTPPVTVGFRWYDAAANLVPTPEHRTRFPIAMLPGRAVTLPIDIETPEAEGSYILVVCPVIEGRCWVAESGIDIPVTIGRVEALPATLDLRPEADPLTYADDHAVAVGLLHEQANRLLAVPNRRILEVGGGAAPQVSWFGPHDVVNVDINLPLLELGSLWYRHNADDDVSERLAFLCADATDLPFESQMFDIVAMFATLHHFPEPEALLRECRRVVRPGGIVAVLCEPVGTTLEHEDTLRDLSKGINEQVFTASEYVSIFQAAGLEVISGTQVGGSLRVFLRRSALGD